ncbi:hypothetical protein L7F22_017474 [Adiantum nelumboides]|nr:hypothetical protein [Adiantum nelumboides]
MSEEGRRTSRVYFTRSRFGGGQQESDSEDNDPFGYDDPEDSSTMDQAGPSEVSAEIGEQWASQLGGQSARTLEDWARGVAQFVGVAVVRPLVSRKRLQFDPFWERENLNSRSAVASVDVAASMDDLVEIVAKVEKRYGTLKDDSDNRILIQMIVKTLILVAQEVQPRDSRNWFPPTQDYRNQWRPPNRQWNRGRGRAPWRNEWRNNWVDYDAQNQAPHRQPRQEENPAPQVNLVLTEIQPGRFQGSVAGICHLPQEGRPYQLNHSMDSKDEPVSSRGEDYWNSENDESDAETTGTEATPSVPVKVFEEMFAGFMQQVKEVFAKAAPPSKKKRKRPEATAAEEAPVEEIPPRPATYPLPPYLPPTHPRFFGGGSVFHTMIGEHAYGPGHFGMGWRGAVAGYEAPSGSTPATGESGGYGMGGPMLGIGHGVPPQPLLKPVGKAKDYKEGGALVKFDSFDGQKNKLKALIFLQQFDAAFSGGHFTEALKVRKAVSFLKGNALQWWMTLLKQGVAPATWVEFKQAFAPLWLTSTFEVDVITACIN